MNPADQQRRMLEMQHKIRNDAQQQQHYLGEFADWNRDIAKKVAAIASTAADISAITDESSSTGKDRKVVAFERIFEPSGAKGRFTPKMEYTAVIDQLIDTYPTLFNEYRKWGKKPKVGGEDYVYNIGRGAVLLA